MAERFYTKSPLELGPFSLGGPEAHHLAVVCRLRPGDRVYLFNGDGRQYPAVVDTIQKHNVALNVTGMEAPARELGFRLEVAAPLPKADRAAFLVEKLTELGVTSLVPLRTARSVVLPRETRLEKLQRTVIEASKQCGRNVLMHIEPLIAWDAFCSRGQDTMDKILAHPGEDMIVDYPSMAGDRIIAVGPEGGFTEEEVALARAAGWRAVGLGPRILRVETAALLLAARAIPAMGSGQR
jgi:16S rRNA (uracil1498-N3)-methyltransferase